MSDTLRQRIDKWLFFARAVKSRSLAAKAAQAGAVRVNGEKIASASHPVKQGDVLTIALERRLLVWRIAALGERRGPAPEARLLYEDLTPVDEPGDLQDPSSIAGGPRPTKRDRRAIDRLFPKAG